MSVPKKRKTKGKTRKGRSHHGLKLSSLGKCSHCGAPKRPHRVCQACGHYQGKPVLKMKNLEKRNTKEKKEKEQNKAKEARQKE
jgi:large subunit ribosomal protein L32